MRVYVASSWRNRELHGEVVRRLREAGDEVYDFTDPTNGKPFSWSEISPDWRGWSAEDVVAALQQHPRAVEGFDSDMGALKAADACVLVMPCGRSAHLEMGYAVGASKRTVVLLDSRRDVPEADLMWAMADYIVTSVDEVVAALSVTEDGLLHLAIEARRNWHAAEDRASSRRKAISAVWNALPTADQWAMLHRVKAYRERTGAGLYSAQEAVLSGRDVQEGGQ